MRKLFLSMLTTSLVFGNGHWDKQDLGRGIYELENQLIEEQEPVQLNYVSISDYENLNSDHKNPNPNVEVIIDDESCSIKAIQQFDEIGYEETLDGVKQMFDSIYPDASDEGEISALAEMDNSLRVITNLTAYPVPYLVRLDIEYYLASDPEQTTTGRGTGFLIGPDTIVTAGHVAKNYDEYGLQWIFYRITATSIEGSAFCDTALIHKKWFYKEDEENDFAILKVDQPLSSSTRYIEMKSSNLNSVATAYGFPQYVPNIATEKYNYLPYRSMGTIEDLESLTLKSSDIRTEVGMSGGPVIDSSMKAVGVISKYLGITGKRQFVRLESDKVFAADYCRDDMVTIYRLYNKNGGEHVFTANWNEAKNLINLGWKYESVAWHGASAGNPVYRLYNPNGGSHHYTIDINEKDSLVKAGWKYEGIFWKAPDKSDYPVYRLYNPNAKSGAHHFTVSIKERNNLIKEGWKYEGIGWYSS